ncbi:MAG: hypothetical protein JWN04_522 [Myxococcaceae bacterium]|nr:hypothetical protein [Myxococcaceae bacterium]
MSHVDARVVRANVGLTLCTFGVLCTGFATREPGQADNRLFHLAQFILLWVYVIATPLLCALGLKRRGHRELDQGSSVLPTRIRLALLFLWLGTLAAASLIHL